MFVAVVDFYELGYDVEDVAMEFSLLLFAQLIVILVLTTLISCNRTSTSTINTGTIRFISLSHWFFILSAAIGLPI